MVLGIYESGTLIFAILYENCVILTGKRRLEPLKKHKKGLILGIKPDLP